MESEYKRRVLKAYRKAGWVCLNLIQTNLNGIADTLLMKRGEEDFFIEFKARGEKPDPLQVYRHEELLTKTGKRTIIMEEP